MKSRILIITLLMLSAIMGFVINRSNTKTNTKNETPQSNSPQENPQNRWLDRFYIGAVHDGIGRNNNYQNLVTLGFNMWHLYSVGRDEGGRNYPWIQWPGFNNYDGDNTNSPVSGYSDFVNPRIEEVKNADPNIRIVTMRPKIEYLCYGQRSDYQCDSILASDDLWFYAFNKHETGIQETDNTQWGAGAKVRHCRTIPMNATTDNPGYVVKELRANTEQSKVVTGGNEWQGDAECDWYVKPKIRIPQGLNPEILVCKIIVVGQNGNNVLKEVDIKAKYFLNDQGYYDGSYLEEYNFGIDPYNLKIHGNWGTNWQYSARGTPLNPDQDNKNKADIQVYWYGNCDMWIDYIRVDNDVADELFKGQRDNWIQDEVQLIGTVDHGIGEPMFMKYYVELVEFNNLPCMAYVNAKLKDYSDNQIDLVQDLTNVISVHVPWESPDGRDRTSIENADFLNEHYIQKVGFTQIFAESYPLSGCFYNPTTSFSKIPNTFTIPNDSILAQAVSPAEYDSWLQDNLNHNPYSMENNYDNADLPCDIGLDSNRLFQDRGNFRYKLQLGNKLSKLANKPFIFMPQAHQWYRTGEVRREPTNEELNMMVNTAVSYGVKGIMYFCYNQYIDPTNNEWYGIGITEGPSNSIRETNLYGQNKGDAIKDISTRLKDKWGPHLLSFDNTKIHSAIYDFVSERTDFLSNTYFYNIITYKPGYGEPTDCIYDGTGESLPLGLTYDCLNKRYIQAATFQTTVGDVNKYFMIVNRRCSPYIDETTEDRRGGKRDIRVKFDANSSDFPVYNNWKIIDIENNETVVIFDKRNSSFLDLGWFMPGEGKLYKIAPVIPSGGTLVADETISGNVNCNGIIHSGGHNITISPGATISFLDTAGIEMNGGSFTCGANADVSPVNLVGKDDSHTWKGLVLSNCSSIGIYKTNISKIHANDTAKAVLISNCYNINIGKSTFNMGSNAGAIQAVFTENTDEPSTFNVSECNFYMGSSSYSAISISSSASNTLPVIIDWCNFNTTNENSNAILLYGVTGGAVKNSVFANYISSINTLTSTIDLYNNTILGGNNSTGILCVNGSSISLSPTSGQYFGGNNYIRNYGGSSSNINSDNSYFNINNGGNNFDLDNIDNSKHLTGNLSGIPYTYVNAMKNCFHKDSITNIDAAHSVIWNSSSELVNFLFTPYTCELTVPNDYFVYQYSGYNDTVYYRAGGEGSGFNPNKPMNIEENVYKSLKDTVNINLRKRNYLTVEDNAKQILTQYPDSLESIGMVQKLYVSSLNLDSTKIGLTKTFFENLISANTQNPGLIKRAFYFIQKCKVKLGQFQSALDGFQYIMTQNPYTYEGLVASWDYAATYLLMGTGGSYKGHFEEQTEELSTPPDTLLSRMTKRDIITNRNTNTNSNKTSTEQITKSFYEKIKNVTKDDKTTQEAKVKTLEKKIETTKNKTEKNETITELAKMKQIKETVKIKKPTTVNVHITMMNDDIKKVFGIGKKSTNETTNNIIPTTYNFYQNYPNPFNPTTKIAYDIPRDAKVKLVIYDILGREMKTLVNNEFKAAGKYITEFNGSNLASGIYFARILVNEGKDFMAVKKMVLIK